jgi:hypothetical protein
VEALAAYLPVVLDRVLRLLAAPPALAGAHLNLGQQAFTCLAQLCTEITVSTACPLPSALCTLALLFIPQSCNYWILCHFTPISGITSDKKTLFRVQLECFNDKLSFFFYAEKFN